jgi:hypothetical protein
MRCMGSKCMGSECTGSKCTASRVKYLYLGAKVRCWDEVIVDVAIEGGMSILGDMVWGGCLEQSGRGGILEGWDTDRGWDTQEIPRILQLGYTQIDTYIHRTRSPTQELHDQTGAQVEVFSPTMLQEPSRTTHIRQTPSRQSPFKHTLFSYPSKDTANEYKSPPCYPTAMVDRIVYLLNIRDREAGEICALIQYPALVHIRWVWYA